MNPLAYNHKEVAGVSRYNFNCGGFALGTFNWVDFDDFDMVADNYGDVYTHENEVAHHFADQLLEMYPWLREVDTYRYIPSRFRVIGFRVDFCNAPDQYDFHFVMRHKNRWYHKPGPYSIEKMDRHVNDFWSSKYGTYQYDSEIIWFIDTREC